MSLRHLFGAMHGLTAAQRKWLQRADHRGLIECNHVGGLSRANFGRVMGNLAKQGFVTPYVHGGYEITAAGRQALERHDQGLG